MGRVRPGRRRACEAALALCLLVGVRAAVVPAFSASSYLLVERPARLQILNKYQQDLDPQQRARLAPFVPMKIMKANDVLGDGFTPCTTVEIDGTMFYLVKGKDGELTGESEAGAMRRIDGAEALGDTVRILSNGAPAMIAPIGEAQRSLRRGDRLVRYFVEGDRTYAGTLSQPARFGFIRLSPSERGRTWDIDRAPQEEAGPSVIPERILAAVQGDIGEVNKVYKGLYEFFNKQTGQQRPVPYWRMASSGRAIVCTLINRPSGADISQSTRYLMKDLENAVLGTPVRVYGSEDRIEIRMEQPE